MNQRINEIFEQALAEFNAENKHATVIVPNPLKERFAELIVRECASISQNDHDWIDEGAHCSNENYRDARMTKRRIANKIRQYFGVAE